MKNKRGISGIVATVIMIALVMAAAAIIWGVINSMIKEKTSSAESCFGNFEKVTLNAMYTCYNSTNGNIQFSINIADVEVDSVLVAISAAGVTKSFGITNTATPITDLGPYPSGIGEVVLPGENAGSTYITDYFADKPDPEPDLIEIAPVISETQCGVSDSIQNIDDCSILG